MLLFKSVVIDVLKETQTVFMPITVTDPLEFAAEVQRLTSELTSYGAYDLKVISMEQDPTQTQAFNGVAIMATMVPSLQDLKTAESMLTEKIKDYTWVEEKRLEEFMTLQLYNSSRYKGRLSKEQAQARLDNFKKIMNKPKAVAKWVTLINPKLGKQYTYFVIKKDNP